MKTEFHYLEWMTENSPAFERWEYGANCVAHTSPGQRRGLAAQKSFRALKARFITDEAGRWPSIEFNRARTQGVALGWNESGHWPEAARQDRTTVVRQPANPALVKSRKSALATPSPWGEGWGEGNSAQNRNTHTVFSERSVPDPLIPTL
jgi:hypothetical protein